MFPSPFGAYLFQIVWQWKRTTENMSKVSVPFRGLSISNYESASIDSRKLGFRPLSGPIYFKLQFLSPSNTQLWFPSPFGAYLFQMKSDITIEDNREFPSPFGAYLFQINTICIILSVVVSFRPLSGPIYFKSSFGYIQNLFQSFRPLSGPIYFK